MKVQNLFSGSFASNCYLLSDHGRAVVIDPSADADIIVRQLTEQRLTLDAIVLTHGHFDHMFSLDLLRDRLNVPALIHELEMDFPTDSQKNAYSFFYGGESVWRAADISFTDGDSLPVGQVNLTVLHTPGHTCGSVCLYNTDEKIIFTGDTLFKDGCGRTDLYSGNSTALLSSFKKLKHLPGDMKMYPGHGESSVLGEALKPLSAYCI